jgi:hypothetical protein
VEAASGRGAGSVSRDATSPTGGSGFGKMVGWLALGAAVGLVLFGLGYDARTAALVAGAVALAPGVILLLVLGVLLAALAVVLVVDAVRRAR